MNLTTVPLVLIGLFSADADETLQLSLSLGTYSVEIADDPLEQMRGLMGRDDLGSHQGMLFVYSQERHVQFWTKNVAFPLDIIFLDQCGKVVQIHENAPPDDTSIISSESPVRAVLELPGGATERDRIRPGDSIRGAHEFFASC